MQIWWKAEEYPHDKWTRRLCDVKLRGGCFVGGQRTRNSKTKKQKKPCWQEKNTWRRDGMTLHTYTWTQDCVWKAIWLTASCHTLPLHSPIGLFLLWLVSACSSHSMNSVWWLALTKGFTGPFVILNITKIASHIWPTGHFCVMSLNKCHILHSTVSLRGVDRQILLPLDRARITAFMLC